MDYFLIIMSIISVIITIFTQIYENWLYVKNNKIPNERKISGKETAEILLRKNKINDVSIKEVNGYLIDHYDSKNKVLKLSNKVYNSTTISAVTIACREVCHIIEDKEKPNFSKLRRIILIIGNSSPPIAYLTIVLGIIFCSLKHIWIGIILEIILLAFQIIILILKTKASNRALKELDYSHLLNSKELSKSKEVLNSVIISSIAKFNTTLLHLFRLISMLDNEELSISKELISYFWIFVLTCFLGFIVETIWCYIRSGKIESRKGVIYEPFIPIYGISGVLIVVVTQVFDLSKNYEIFLIGFVISTIIEFICSFLQEKIFATKSWDYSNFPLNISGRVNLLYSLLFGIISLISYKFVLAPFTNIFMETKVTGLILSLTIYRFIYMIYDFLISALAVYRMKERKNKICRKGIFWDYIDEKYSDNFLKTIYANMVDIEK